VSTAEPPGPSTWRRPAPWVLVRHRSRGDDPADLRCAWPLRQGSTQEPSPPGDRSRPHTVRGVGLRPPCYLVGLLSDFSLRASSGVCGVDSAWREEGARACLLRIGLG
jgi:hypothetical protein